MLSVAEQRVVTVSLSLKKLNDLNSNWPRAIVVLSFEKEKINLKQQSLESVDPAKTKQNKSWVQLARPKVYFFCWTSILFLYLAFCSGVWCALTSCHYSSILHCKSWLTLQSYRNSSKSQISWHIGTRSFKRAAFLRYSRWQNTKPVPSEIMSP